MQDNLQKYLAEAIGTFVLVFIAAGVNLANWKMGGSIGIFGIASATGIALASMIYAFGHISGGHFNPAVTISFWATGLIKSVQAVFYVIAQLAGSVVAAILLKAIFVGVSPQYFLADTTLTSGVTPGMGILVEAILTFIFLLTIYGALVDKKAVPGFGGLMVGAVLAALIMVGGSLTMGALNPARSFGPALVSSHWAVHYVYWVGPVIGAVVAGFMYRFGLSKK